MERWNYHSPRTEEERMAIPWVVNWLLDHPRVLHLLRRLLGV